MKKSLLLLAALTSSSLAYAQQTVTITAGTGPSALSPFDHTKPYTAYEVIYLQNQINLAGTITNLAFDKADGTDLTPFSNTVLYLKTTTNTQFATGALDTTGYQRVWAGAFPNSSPSGFQSVTLSRPFLYNNTDNLSLLVLRNNGSVAGTGTRARWKYAFLGSRQACRRYNNTTPLSNATSLTSSDVLVNLQLTFATPTATRFAAEPLQVSLFPNPASSYCTVQFPAAGQPAQLRITDLMGRPVAAEQPLRLAADGTAQLPVQSLAAGSYLLHLSQGTAKSVQRFIKE